MQDPQDTRPKSPLKYPSRSFPFLPVASTLLAALVAVIGGLGAWGLSNISELRVRHIDIENDIAKVLILSKKNERNIEDYSRKEGLENWSATQANKDLIKSLESQVEFLKWRVEVLEKQWQSRWPNYPQIDQGRIPTGEHHFKPDP